MSYGYDPNWSNFIFISSPEDMKKELELKDIGKELFFLTKHAFCETCNKSLKAFGSEEKAKIKVDKHLATKKYAGHKAFVKTIDFSEFNKCTTADILGTKANRDRNEDLRNSFYGVIRGQITRLIADNEDIIAKVQKAFSLTDRTNNLSDTPTSLKTGDIYLVSEDGRVKGTIEFDDFKHIRELFEGTWGEQKQDLHERASYVAHYIHLDGVYSNEHVYAWDYPIVYDDFVGFNVEQAGECNFCHKNIESWNDLVDGSHIYNKYVHRDCYKHFRESESLQEYAEKYQKKIAQEVITS